MSQTSLIGVRVYTTTDPHVVGRVVAIRDDGHLLVTDETEDTGWHWYDAEEVHEHDNQGGHRADEGADGLDVDDGLEDEMQRLIDGGATDEYIGRHVRFRLTGVTFENPLASRLTSQAGT